jgi:HSP20 family protein
MKSRRVSHQQQSNPPTTSLGPRESESLRSDMQDIQLAIASRAYELFEARNREHGHDWEDWFRAESELLRPVSISISESNDVVSVRANVFGFEENELKVSIEPHRIAILGKKKTSPAEPAGGKVEYVDWHPDRILQFIDLATEVIPERSSVELQDGLLKFELPKAVSPKADPAVAA